MSPDTRRNSFSILYALSHKSRIENALWPPWAKKEQPNPAEREASRCLIRARRTSISS